jgi:hypothetical protein
MRATSVAGVAVVAGFGLLVAMLVALSLPWS